MIKARVLSLGFLTLMIITLFYLLETKRGYDRLEKLIEYYLSDKVESNIDITLLDIKNYPNIRIELTINNGANLSLYGIINKETININYHLWGDSLKFNQLNLNDTFNLFGRLKGRLNSFDIYGHGEIFDGYITYKLNKTKQEIKDIKFSIKRAKSEKILLFLDEEPLIKSFIDINGTFSTFGKYTKIGQTKLYLHKTTIPIMENNLTLTSTMLIDFNNTIYRYRGIIDSDIASVNIKSGLYHEGKKRVTFNYNLLIKQLGYFNNFLDKNIQDNININGEFLYKQNNNSFKIDGNSNKFGGDIKFQYEKNSLTIKLQDVSLVKIVNFFDYQSLFDTDIYGNISFNIKEKITLINLRLNRLHFFHNDFSKSIEKELSVDIVEIAFNQNRFYGGYKDSILHTTLKIDDGKRNHIFLTNSSFNMINKKIYSKFEMILNGKEVFGQINGTLDNPQFDVDRDKYIEYKIKKAFGG